MNLQEKLGRYEYTVYEIQETMIIIKEEIEELRKIGQYDDPTCIYLMGQLDSHKESLYSLTGDKSVFKE